MRITVVSSYFPSSARPYGGNSAFQTLRALEASAAIEVVCLYPRYLNFAGLKPPGYVRADLHWRPPAFTATYVEYPAIPFLTRPFNGAICARILLPYIRATRPDLILNYWLYPDGYAAARAGRALGVPVVVGAIGSDLRFRNDPITIRLVRQTMLRADAVITVSEELRQQAIAQGIPAEKVTAIRNGCDTAIFHPGDPAEARRAVACDPGSELIVYAGNLLAEKGLAELMEVFARLAPTRPRLRLALIGQGPYRETLERRASALPAGKIILPGRMDAAGIAQWMRAADIFCLPSYSEGCPNAVVEALACGRPVVATNVGGIPELVNETNGLLAPARDASALAAALGKALDRTWDAAGIARASTRSWNEVAAETLAVCRRAAARHAGSHGK